MKHFVLLLLLLLLLPGCIFFRPGPTKLYRRAVKQAPFDVAIVPGSPFDGKQWDRTMQGRVLWAAYLYKKGLVKNIIFSGSAVYTPYVEARIMKLYAISLGVPAENIFTEEKAEHSTENIYYSYHMAKKLGFTRIAVATDPFQSPMLMGFTRRRFRLPITHIPFVVDSLSKMEHLDPKIDPQSALRPDFRSIVETQSRWYRFRGTAGMNIRFEKE